MMIKIYLRVIEYSTIRENEISIFEGDIEKDREYWNKYHNAKSRYFELKEIKNET
jgi:hypothetical protein